MKYINLKLDAEARALGLEVLHDDFSIRVVQAEDPMFWIRIEMTGSEHPTITDFTQSSFNYVQMAIALQHVLVAGGYPFPSRLFFRNVSIPRESIEKNFRPTLGQYAKQNHRFLSKLEVLELRGKKSLVADFTE